MRWLTLLAIAIGGSLALVRVRDRPSTTRGSVILWTLAAELAAALWLFRWYAAIPLAVLFTVFGLAVLSLWMERKMPPAEPDMRARIARLERAKDHALRVLEGPWTSDAKEAYFGTVAAYQLLRGKHGGTGEAALAIAQSRAEQAASALEGADAEEFRAAFAACRETLVTLLPPRPADKAPAERVLRRGENSFELPCSVCSAPAVLIHAQGEQIAYEGITKSTTIPADGEVFALLARGELPALHLRLQRHAVLEDGIDGYCPQCDRIYCARHYSPREEYDEGFYDCTRGTCPQGHSRILDD